MNQPKDIGSRYTVVRLLGSGGMSHTYLCEDVEQGGLVAVKVLHAVHSRKERAVARFRLEGSLLCSLAHPGLIRGLDTDSYEDRWITVTVFVEGRELSRLVSKGRGLGLQGALAAAQQVAECLDYLHNCGVKAHRDIKPQNVMVSRDGVARILDLGIARTDLPGAVDETEGTFLGSPHYMSPEQIRDPREADARSDIYSLGACMFELATGRKAYDGDSVMPILDAHMNLSAPQVAGDGDFMQRFNEILNRCCASDPSLRYVSAGELASETRELLEEVPQEVLRRVLGKWIKPRVVTPSGSRFFPERPLGYVVSRKRHTTITRDAPVMNLAGPDGLVSHAAFTEVDTTVTRGD